MWPSISWCGQRSWAGIGRGCWRNSQDRFPQTWGEGTSVGSPCPRRVSSSRGTGSPTMHQCVHTGVQICACLCTERVLSPCLPSKAPRLQIDPFTSPPTKLHVLWTLGLMQERKVESAGAGLGVSGTSPSSAAAATSPEGCGVKEDGAERGERSREMLPATRRPFLRERSSQLLLSFSVPPPPAGTAGGCDRGSRGSCGPRTRVRSRPSFPGAAGRGRKGLEGSSKPPRGDRSLPGEVLPHVVLQELCLGLLPLVLRRRLGGDGGQSLRCPR